MYGRWQVFDLVVGSGGRIIPELAVFDVAVEIGDEGVKTGEGF